MPRPKADTVQVTFRIPTKWLKEFDVIAKRLSDERHGINITRTDAVRACLCEGLTQLGGKR